MAGITLAEAEAQLATWLEASTAVAAKQSYKIGSGDMSRELTYADAGRIRDQIEFWDAKVKRLAQGGSNRARRGVVY